MSKIVVRRSELSKIIHHLEKASYYFSGIGDGNWAGFLEEEAQQFGDAEIILDKTISRLKKLAECPSDID